MSPFTDWLQSIGLAHYAQVFFDNDIDLEVMPSLSEQDLEKLGVSMGHRKKLLKAIADLDSRTVNVLALATSSGTQTDAAGESKVLAKTSAEPGERRQLTVLFCDMVGFTELASRLDPEILQKVIRAYEDACAVCITRYDGYVFQRLGDGIVAFFGYPLAHEGEAERAIHAGLAIIDSLAGLEVADVGRLSVRIGIATGMVVVSSVEKSAVGETMNLASRLQGIAPVGAIIVSERVRQLAGGRFVIASLGEQTLKGIHRPTAAHRIVGVSEVASRFEAATQEGLTAMVGRDQEIGLLLDRWQQAQGGEGQVVLLSGEPGIGKSRVLNALRERLEANGANTLRFQCSPYYTTSAFYPSIDNFERALKYARDETTESKLDKLEALIVTRYGRPRDDVRYIAAMLSIPFEARYGHVNMSPQRFKDETLRFLADLSEAAARKQPTVMLFEDAHWADPTTLEVLDLLIDRVKGFPLLIVLTHRPEFQSRWSSQGHVAALNLSKLTKAQSSAIVSNLAQGNALPGNLLEQILTKTDGVPLYVEELTKSILESGEIKEAGDPYKHTGTTHGVSIPASLRDSLMSRLDRFAPIKEIAQIGSVIGREFSYELIHAVAPRTSAELDQALSQLTDSGLASRRGTPPEAHYTFKHALVQDAAYDSLLKSRRRELHGKIARVLEESFPASKDAKPELLAHHFGAAGMAQVAIDYWLRAAKRAADRSTYREALDQLDAGTTLLESLPAGRERTLSQLRLQLQRAAALLASKGYSATETGSAWAAARELSDQLGDDVRETFSALLGISVFHVSRGELLKAEETAREMLRRADKINDPALLMVAHNRLGTALSFRGALQEADQHFAHAVRLYDPIRDRESYSLAGSDFKAISLAHQSPTLHLLGYPDRALAANREAINHAESLGHAHGVAATMWLVLLLAMLRREPSRVLEHAKRMMTLSDQHGFPLWCGSSKFASGVALVDLGATAQGMDLIRTWLDWTKAMVHRVNRTFYISALAAGEAVSKQWEAAANRLDEATSEVEVTDERWYEAEIHRLKGEFLLARDRVAMAAQAEVCFDQSLSVARAQSAKTWELRTAMSLAKLWQSQGRREDAHGLLAPIYGWFTEGFDTVDLKEAKALLKELAA